LWDSAERCYGAASEWGRAGQAAVSRSALETSPVARAKLLARAAHHFAKHGDETAVVENLERAVDLDPEADDYARVLSERYAAGNRYAELVALFTKRADRLHDTTRRVASRRLAARLLATQLRDKDAARDVWRKVLSDGDDPEALSQLVDDAVEREDYDEATGLLRRLESTAEGHAEKARIALREAELVADGLGDVATAIARYERVLAELDPASRPALQAIADLQEANDNPRAAAAALERELRIVDEAGERAPIAERLARIYEQLDDPEKAIVALEVLRKADPDDFDALARLCDLCEKTKKWDKVAELLAQRIEVEADDAEMSVLTNRLANVLADELGRGDEALAVLTELADQGDATLRATYVRLGDRLGWRGIVASKLVEWWFEAKPGAERIANLRGAFDRFADVGRVEEAVRVGCELARSRGADAPLAHRLEELALKTHDLDALSVAHDLIARDTTGSERAVELVRQAEVRFAAGAPKAEAISHGEQGLTSVAPAEAEELLQRLAAIAEDAGDVVDLYERQIGRCKTPSDRVSALGRAAQVAAAYNQMDRARSLFDLALSGTPTDDAVLALEEAAREADANLGDERMRRAISASLASGGQGARDGGRTRGALLRRAASMAHKELGDDDQAFAWLAEALVAHVEPQTLDALESLARELREPERAELTLTRALGEVFDGPLVRQLLARRAKMRRDELGDSAGAAADLRKLYELAPADQATLDDLTALLTELGDHRAMVQLYEDQILRGKDLHARAELARKVARMWEVELADPREAADAWRRVLRMKQGDAEAQAGLERAKANMLRKSAAPPPPSERPDSDLIPIAPPEPAVAEPPAEAHAEDAAESATTAARDDAPPVAWPPPMSAPASDPVAEPAPASGVAHVSHAHHPHPVLAAAEDSAADLPMTVDEAEESAGEAAEALEAAAPEPGEVDQHAQHAEPAEPPAAAPAGAAEQAEGDDVVIADDLAEMLDAEVDAEEVEAVESAESPKTATSSPPPLPKRTIPPPLPRA
jgi:tetratricopeptide (TPR) repeat protein